MCTFYTPCTSTSYTVHTRMVLHEGGDYQKMIAGIDPPQEPEVVITEMPSKPGWIRAHPYFAATIATLGLLILGTTLFLQRTDVNPASSSGAWGGAGGLFFANLRATAPYRPSAEDVTYVQSIAQAVPFIPIPKPSQSNQQEGAEGETHDNIAALLALLVQPNSTAAGSSEETPDTYAFIPQGFITTSTSNESRTVTPGQESGLHEYGNQVGTYIKDFEDMHRAGPQILKDHIEDRANPQKIAALERLASDMEYLGISLLEMDYVPANATAMHKAYAAAYKAAGANLIKVSETTTDEEFVDAIATYNASVEELTKRFLMLVALFGANNITFSSSDPGSVFMFNPSLSL